MRAHRPPRPQRSAQNRSRSADPQPAEPRGKPVKRGAPPPLQDGTLQPAPPARVQMVTVSPDEAGMRLDRFLEARFPTLAFSHIQRIIRKGELRVNGRRAEPNDRLQAGQAVRIPPLRRAPREVGRQVGALEAQTREYLRSITLYEDDDVLVINKPFGLAVQGGSGTHRHVDGML